MAWTTPKTWSSEPLTSNDLNTYIRDNQNHLKNRLDNNDDYILDETLDYTTTSTSSFVDVDNTNLALTITTNGGDVLVGFFGNLTVASSPQNAYFNLDVGGVAVAGDDGIVALRCQFSTAPGEMLGFVYLLSGLSAGLHTIKLQWKTSGSTLKLYAGAATSSADLHPQFWVQEL